MIKGLTDEEVKKRVEEGKINSTNTNNLKSNFEIVRDNVCTLFNLFNLIIAIALACVHAYTNMVFIVIIIINVLIGIIQEIHGKNLVKKLSILTAVKSKVIRNGEENEIDINEIKPFEKPKDLITQDLSYLFEDIELHENAMHYINSRNIKHEKSFGQWFYANINLNIGDKNHNLSDSIVIPLYTPKYEMYGFYSRSIKYKHFSTYINEKNSGYKIWNWFFINKDEPVYIFEGIFDAITAINAGLKNSIACMGAMLPDDKLRELKHPILCLDNDKTGLNNTLKLVQKYNLDAFIIPDEYNVKDLNEFKNKYFSVDIKNLIKNNTFSGLYTIIVLRNRL